jgi:hypothetical protein
VPRGVWPLVDGGRRGGVQLRGGEWSGDRRTAEQHREDRVLLLRHRRRTARRGLGQFADLRTGAHEHVVGDPSPRVDAADERVADASDRPAVRVPRRDGREPDVRGKRLDEADRGRGIPGQRDDRGERSGCAAGLDG